MRSVSVAPGAVNRSTTPYAKFCSDAVTGLPSMGARPPLPPVLPAVGWRASSDVLTWLHIWHVGWANGTLLRLALPCRPMSTQV